MQEQLKSISLKKDLSDVEYAELTKLRAYLSQGIVQSNFSTRVVALSMIEQAMNKPGISISTPNTQAYCKAATSAVLVSTVEAELCRLNCYSAFRADLGGNYLRLEKPADKDRKASYRFSAVRSYFHGEEISAT